MEKVQVCVTQEDIDNGVVGDENSCPIALALCRNFPEYDVTVGKNAILLEGKKGSTSFFQTLATSRTQYRFVRRFDAGKLVKPFCFDIIDPANQEIKPSENFINALAEGREVATKR